MKRRVATQSPRRVGDCFGRKSTALAMTLSRLHHHKIIKGYIHAGLREGTSQYAHITGL